MNKNLTLAKGLARKLELPLKILSVEEDEEGTLTFHFSSEGRLELRDLIKKLQEKTKRKILAQQVSFKEAVQFLTGVGLCGQRLCCATFLKTSAQFSLTDTLEEKGSNEGVGLCGRKMCCLTFEGEKTSPPEEIPTEKPAETPSRTKESPKPPSTPVLRVLPRKKPRHRR